MAKMRVVLTGASGYIARRMWKELDERYDLVALDSRAHGPDGKEIPGVRICDLTNDDRSALREHLRGADAIIHWIIVNARRVIGYQPEDNSQVNFAGRITELAKG